MTSEHVYRLDRLQCGPHAVICPADSAHGRLQATGNGMGVVCGVIVQRNAKGEVKFCSGGMTISPADIEGYERGER